MPVALLAQALALATAAGVSTYATVAILGLAAQLGWIHDLPPALAGLANWWIIALAGGLYAMEFLATLIPGVASAWEAVHSTLRPLAGTALAVATTWHGSPALIVAAALLGGTLSMSTQATKLGARVAIDASPEPFSNGIANVAEAGFVGTVSLLVWQHPYWALAIALVTLLLIAILVRTIWRTLGRVFNRRPAI
jgi:hypothetical protein